LALSFFAINYGLKPATWEMMNSRQLVDGIKLVTETTPSSLLVIYEAR